MVNKELIFSYFAGNCTAFQKRIIAEWALEKSNQELFFLWLCEWERHHVQYHVDVEAGLHRHRAWKASLANAQKSAIPKRYSFFRISLKGQQSLAVACSIVLGILSLGWLFQDKLLYTAYNTSYGEIRKITLPDQSRVILNANSLLMIPRFAFLQNQRVVHLNGEASFEVVHTADHRRFIVKTADNLEVKVLGTEFNIYSRPSGNRVVLKRGKIQLNYVVDQEPKILEMKPGEMAQMDAKGDIHINQVRDLQSHLDWQYHRFVFEDLTFREVGERLHELFGSRLLFEEETLARQLISGSFTALNAEELLELLAEAGHFHYRKQGNDFVISHKKKAMPDPKP